MSYLVWLNWIVCAPYRNSDNTAQSLSVQLKVSKSWACVGSSRIVSYRICACISRIFLTRIYPPKLGHGLYTEYYALLTTEPAMLILYVVKLPVETASVWDCYLASYCTGANAPTYYRCIGIFLLHESSRQHQIPRSRKAVTSLTNYSKYC
jgi:hypothetical protein